MSDGITIESLQELSSYQSVIKFYGRAILPPLLSSTAKEEFKEIRCQAALAEKRILERWKEREKLTEEFQDIINKVSEYQNSPKAVNQTSAIETPNEVPSSNDPLFNRDQSEAVTSTRETDEDLAEYSRTPTPTSRPNSGYGNALLDNAESFCAPQLGLNSFLNCPEFKVSALLPSDKKQDISSEINNLVSSSYAGSEFSDDRRLSETEDTECISLATVILNTYESLGCDLDSESIVTSVAQSTDLDKYLDCSVEDGKHSADSTIIGDELDLSKCRGDESGNHDEINHKRDSSTSSVAPSCSGNTFIIESSVNRSNEMHELFQTTHERLTDKSEILTANSDKADVGLYQNDSVVGLMKPIDVTSESSVSPRMSPFENQNDQSDNMLKQEGIKEIDNMNLNTDKNDALGAGSSTKTHVRRHSYTLEYPSPVLVRSHAGCKCEQCPAMQVSPHSRSMDLEEIAMFSDNNSIDLFVPNSVLDAQGPSSSETKLPHSSSLRDVVCYNSGEEPAMIGTSTEDNYPLPCVRTRNEAEQAKFLTELYETFKEVHKQKVEELLQQQHDQWMALQEEYKEQEKMLQEQLETLKIADTRDDLETVTKNPFSSSNTSSSSVFQTEPNLKMSKSYNDVASVFYPPEEKQAYKQPIKSSASCKSPSNSDDIPPKTKTTPKQTTKKNWRRKGSLDLTTPSRVTTPTKTLTNSDENINRLSDASRYSTFSAGSTPDKFASKALQKSSPGAFKPISSDVSRQRIFSTKASTGKPSGSRVAPIKALVPASSFINPAKGKVGAGDRDRVVTILKAINDPDMKKKYDKVSAAVKGYLTRRLLQSEPLQKIIKSITDIAVLTIKFYDEADLRKEKGVSLATEAELHAALIRQLNSACQDLHDILFNTTIKQRMEIIARSRELVKKKSLLSEQVQNLQQVPVKRNLSSATLKVLERKKLRSSGETRATSASGLHAKKSPNKASAHYQRRANSCESRPLSPYSAYRASKPNTPDKWNRSSPGVLARMKSTARRSLYN